MEMFVLYFDVSKDCHGDIFCYTFEIRVVMEIYSVRLWHKGHWVKEEADLLVFCYGDFNLFIVFYFIYRLYDIYLYVLYIWHVPSLVYSRCGVNVEMLLFLNEREKKNVLLLDTDEAQKWCFLFVNTTWFSWIRIVSYIIIIREGGWNGIRFILIVKVYYLINKFNKDVLKERG